MVRTIACASVPASATVGKTWATSDATQALTAALVDSLIAVKVYVNFRTGANPRGEIKGQVKYGSDVVTSVERTSGAIPSSFSFQQNYPNRFNHRQDQV